MQEVRVVTPSKVNLALRVGSARPDGFHPLDTVFEALDVHDEVIVRRSDSLSLRVQGEGAGALPEDSTNLALRAATALRERFGAPDLGAEMTVRKAIPVAGGMAGGSADAAGALVALNALWGLGLSGADLMGLGSELGSDVPFCIMGGIAHGTGRGEILTPVHPGRGHAWVLLTNPVGLSTPAVFREFDRIAAAAEGAGPAARGVAAKGAGPFPREVAGTERPGRVAAGDAGSGRAAEADVAENPASTRQLREAVARGDLRATAALMANDLQAPAFSLRPDLEDVVERASRFGATAILSGSGPTVALLASDAAHADRLAMRAAIEFPKLRAVRANGPAAGACVAEAK